MRFPNSIAKNAVGCSTGLKSKFCVILGSQWGDEGKGKLVDILAKDYDVCARFNGGANAGHTVVADGHKYAFHLLPCGILYPTCDNLLGNGVVVNIQSMFDELKQLDDNGIDYKGRLKMSSRAHLVSNIHMEADKKQEAERQAEGAKQVLGTTAKGIGPTYAAKSLRMGLRVGDLADWDLFLEKYDRFVKVFEKQFSLSNFDKQQELDQFRQLYEKFNGSGDKMIVDGIDYMHEALTNSNKRIIAEGANATMLDIDFGTYPYVTSSSTGIGGVGTGLGVPPQSVETTIGIMKAYTTRVGAGPFPTWLDNEIGDTIQEVGHEFGATTGRRRKCGWLDLNVVKYAHKLNGFHSLNITKLDVLTGIKDLKIATHYTHKGRELQGSMPATVEELAECETVYVDMPGWTEDISKCSSFEELPLNARNYIEFIEKEVNVPITWIGNGPAREEMFLKH